MCILPLPRLIYCGIPSVHELVYFTFSTETLSDQTVKARQKWHAAAYEGQLSLAQLCDGSINQAEVQASQSEVM